MEMRGSRGIRRAPFHVVSCRAPCSVPLPPAALDGLAGTLTACHTARRTIFSLRFDLVADPGFGDSRDPWKEAERQLTEERRTAAVFPPRRDIKFLEFCGEPGRQDLNFGRSSFSPPRPREMLLITAKEPKGYFLWRELIQFAT
jgi:hypothetical protein